jgi:hypothetical protein
MKKLTYDIAAVQAFADILASKFQQGASGGNVYAMANQYAECVAKGE